MDGVLIVDKPRGPTSHDVVAAVRRAAGQRKVGHTGTLDPMATGVLVVCLGRATRLVPYLQASTKTYDARMRLGVTTTSLDADGRVVARSDPSGIDEDAVCEALQAFVGDIEQIPPMVSAVKIGGERLHVKARRGEVVERPARPVTIHDLVLEEFRSGPEAEAAFLVTCSSGTYVRTLAADVGERLGVGAHLIALRRLGSGRFTVDDAVSLAELEALGPRLHERLLSPAQALADYPTRALDESEAEALGHGRTIPHSGRSTPTAAFDARGRFVALVEDRDEGARPLVVFPPEAS